MSTIDSVYLSGGLSVTLLQIASSFLFLDGIEPFLAASSPFAPLQNVVLRFLINAQTLHKILYKSACMAYRMEMFGPTRGFWGCPIQWNHAKCCGAETLVAMATKFGLGTEIQSPTGLFLLFLVQ